MKSDALGPTAHTVPSGKTKSSNTTSLGSKNDKIKPTHTPAKTKTSSTVKPVLNGTGGCAPRENSSTSGARGSPTGKTVLDRKPNPGARPKSSAGSDLSTGHAKGGKLQKNTMPGKDLPQESASNAQNTPSNSGSTSPDNSAGSPRNNGHSTPTGEFTFTPHTSLNDTLLHLELVPFFTVKREASSKNVFGFASSKVRFSKTVKQKISPENSTIIK